MRISFLIPTKDGGEGFEKLIKSIKFNIDYAHQRGHLFEHSVVLIINGDSHKPLRFIDSSKDLYGFVKIEQTSFLGKVKCINSYLKNNNSDIVIILDDDVYFADNLLHPALRELHLNRNIRLVSFQTRALPYKGRNPLNRFLYDVINVRSLKNLYRNIDPFLVGRFVVIRREWLMIPDYIINEDLYLSVIHDKHYLIRPEEVFYVGEYSLLKHIKRVLRIEAGRNQIREIFGPTYNIILAKNKRKIDLVKLNNLTLYYRICYYCYGALRFFTNSVFTKLFKHETPHW